LQDTKQGISLTVCRNISEHFDLFPNFSSVLAKFLCVLLNYLDLSNLSFLASAKQFICKTPPLADFVTTKNDD